MINFCILFNSSICWIVCIVIKKCLDEKVLMRKLSFQIYARKYLLDEEKKGKLMNIEHMCMFLGESKEKVKKRFAPTVVFPKKWKKFLPPTLRCFLLSSFDMFFDSE